MMHVGDIMSTSGGYHQYIRGIPSVYRGGDIMIHVGSKLVKSFQFVLKTHDVLMISPKVLMVSPHAS